MYYDETVINGVLHIRTTPEGEWRPMTLRSLTSRLVKAEGELRDRDTWDIQSEDSTKLKRIEIL